MREHRLAAQWSEPPHGVIIGTDGAPWLTDGALNAIVRVDPASHAIRSIHSPLT